MSQSTPKNTEQKKVIRIATRQSKLAQIQATQVGEALKKADPSLSYEFVFITTTGDKFMGDLAKVGGKVAFVKEIQHALLDGRADLAAHSMKDLPTDVVKGLEVAAVLERGDIRDVACCRGEKGIASLKEGAVVGTSSVRRQAQILATFPHLKVVPIRGNVDSRLQKLENKEVDALILAKVGLERLGLQSKISDVLEPDLMCPSVSQGAICIEAPVNSPFKDVFDKINHEPTARCVQTERAFLDHLGGNCHTPIAGFVQITKNNNLRLIGLVSSLDGQTILRTRHKMEYDQWQELAKAAANDLVAQGAVAVIAATEESA